MEVHEILLAIENMSLEAATTISQEVTVHLEAHLALIN